ncbi:uncharacterized protein LOC18018241 [Eutrema salsugineum]|uniref:uncharacterized protein LOC18018241 n=1 Tax=Eutrema salsugineum TaxID=72664 RepID=UPI000CED00DA|nr:uncharacterized protein LOC18018241 [Eutrema salsugineum]
METKQVKVMFLILSVIMALACRHQSEAQSPVPSPEACFAPIKSVKGCPEALERVKYGDFKGLGKDCCHAINGLPGDCFPIIFPQKPFAAYFVKRHCRGQSADVN